MLNRLKHELLARSPEACLPANLSDEWLAALSDSVDMLLGESPESDAQAAALCTGVVVRLLEVRGYKPTDLVELPSEELHEYFVRYRLELVLETIHRNTDVRYEAATLQTILTERDVITYRDFSRKI